MGIWLDHATAHAMTYADDSIITETIHSDFTHQEKEEVLGRSEQTMHNKEQQLTGSYYKRIGDVIKNYEKVLLFGPTNAKNELANQLKEDHHFDEIEIELKSADKMNEHQMEAFVRDYFDAKN